MRIRGKEKVPLLLAEAKPILHDFADGYLAIPSDRSAYLEVGCGRGTFITECAAREPQSFFVGIDKYTPIVARSASLTMAKGLTNVKILDLDVERAPAVFHPHVFTGLYLNFSDPWPRRRNDIKRLTHPRMLSIMAQLLHAEGYMELKSDNAAFFTWSEEMLIQSGWTLLSVTHQLSANPPVEEAVLPRFIQTEYEQRFRALGIPIHHLAALPPKES